MSELNASDGDLYASLTYDNATEAIEFFSSAFGFRRRFAVAGPDDTVVHSELTLGNAVIMVSSPRPVVNRVGQKGLGGISCGTCLRIDDPVSHYENAKARGAEIVQELQEEDFGSRGYMAKDLEGHVWYFGTYRPGEYWEDGSEFLRRSLWRLLEMD